MQEPVDHEVWVHKGIIRLVSDPHIGVRPMTLLSCTTALNAHLLHQLFKISHSNQLLPSLVHYVQLKRKTRSQKRLLKMQ